MTIWCYSSSTAVQTASFRPRLCLFCREAMAVLHDNEIVSEGDIAKSTAFDRLGVCPCCGWWAAERYTVSGPKGPELSVHTSTTYGAIGALKKFEPVELGNSIDDVRAFLVAKYEARNELHPRIFEKTVASVFRNVGYGALVTGYSNDGGIDVVLSDGTNEIGVQVKRTRNSIKVSRLRELVGSLVLGGYTKGMFVTTSDYQRGGSSTVSKALERGVEVELVNAQQFYDALKLSQRPMYGDLEEFLCEHDLDFEQLPQRSTWAGL